MIRSLLQWDHSSILASASWVKTSKTRPPMLFIFSSCECSHGRGPKLHCSVLLHWSTQTLKPWLQRSDPSWHTDCETRTSTSGGLSSTTWPFLPTLERKKKRQNVMDVLCHCALLRKSGNNSPFTNPPWFQLHTHSTKVQKSQISTPEGLTDPPQG